MAQSCTAHFFIMVIDSSKKKRSLVPCWILFTSLDQKAVIKFVWPNLHNENVMSIQHTTTVFTRPALSGFTIQASIYIFWLFRCVHFVFLFPDLILHDAFWYLYTISFFQFGLQKIVIIIIKILFALLF